MSQANNSNDIFQFNAVNAWLSASFAAKCMLSNSRQFVTNESNFVLGMNTMKMVEAWHQHVLTPMEKHISKKLIWSNLPHFAKEIVKDYFKAIEDLDEDVNKAKELNLRLLWKASQLMSNQYRRVGPNTRGAIEKWFEYMKTAKLFTTRGSVPRTAQKFQAVCDAFQDLSGQGDTGRTEYPRFYPDTTFIHISYMTHYACRKMTNLSGDDMQAWESMSGRMSFYILSPGHESWSLPDPSQFHLQGYNNTMTDPTIGMMTLPVSNFHRQINYAAVPNTSDSMPNVFSIYGDLLYQIQEKLLDSAGGEQSECDQMLLYDELMETTLKSLSKAETLYKQNMKAMRSYAKQHCSQAGKSYSPRTPKKFNKDGFIMGRESYHHIFVKRNYKFPKIVTPFATEEEDAISEADGLLAIL